MVASKSSTFHMLTYFVDVFFFVCNTFVHKETVTCCLPYLMFLLFSNDFIIFLIVTFFDDLMYIRYWKYLDQSSRCASLAQSLATVCIFYTNTRMDRPVFSNISVQGAVTKAVQRFPINLLCARRQYVFSAATSG